jgi:hypothetical protein
MAQNKPLADDTTGALAALLRRCPAAMSPHPCRYATVKPRWVPAARAQRHAREGTHPVHTLGDLLQPQRHTTTWHTHSLACSSTASRYAKGWRGPRTWWLFYLRGLKQLGATPAPRCSRLVNVAAVHSFALRAPVPPAPSWQQGTGRRGSRTHPLCPAAARALLPHCGACQQMTDCKARSRIEGRGLQLAPGSSARPMRCGARPMRCMRARWPLRAPTPWRPGA